MKTPGTPGFAYDWSGDVDPEWDDTEPSPEWDAELERIALSVAQSPVARTAGAWDVRLAYSDDQERADDGKFGSGSGSSTKVDERPQFAGSIVEPVRVLVDGKASFNAANGLAAPSDRDWSAVMADPELGAQIAGDYDAMSDYNEQAEPAYDALAGEVEAQFDYLTNELGIEVEFMDVDPYDSVAALKADIENGRLGVLRTDATPPGHPYITNEQNDMFRAVHDAFGHAAIGRGFDRNGEEAAFQSHAEMFTPTAMPALASETRGQNSALNFGGYGARGEFPPQKFDLLPTADLNIDTGRTTLAAAVQAAAAGNADDDNLYEVSRSHHVSMGRSFEKPPLPLRPAPPHTSLGRHAAPRAAAVTSTPARVRRAQKQLTKLRTNLGRTLIAKAEIAYAEALRRAGVKVQTRARSRGTSSTVKAQLASVMQNGGPLRPMLAALGLKEHDLLAGALVTYEVQALAAFNNYERRRRQALIDAGLDPDDYLDDPDSSGAELRKTEAVAVIAAALMALARGRLLGGIDHVMPGEVTGAVPAGLVLAAIGIAEGRSTVTHGATPDEPPTIIPLPDAPTIEEELAALVDAQPVYTWVHGMYGDPVTVFEPHEQLDGFTTTEPRTDPLLTIEDSWPESDYYQPGDHVGCTCGWEVSTAVAEGQMTLTPAEEQ